MLNRIVRVYSSLAVVLLLGCSACTALKDVLWPTTVKCLTQPSTAAVERVKAIVDRDGLDHVMSAESQSALQSAALEFGADVVICVIKGLIDAYTAPTGFAAPPDRLAAARRAQDFLNQHEIVVQESGQ